MTTKTTKRAQLEKAIDALAATIPGGELMASTGPCSFLLAVRDELIALRGEADRARERAASAGRNCDEAIRLVDERDEVAARLERERHEARADAEALRQQLAALAAEHDECARLLETERQTHAAEVAELRRCVELAAVEHAKLEQQRAELAREVEQVREANRGLAAERTGLAEKLRLAEEHEEQLEQQHRELAGELGCVVEVLDACGAPTVDPADPPDGHKLAPCERVKVVTQKLKAATQAPAVRDTWTEEIGAVLWWRFPVVEPPYAGTPLDCDFPEYATHWTPIHVPADPPRRQTPKGGLAAAVQNVIGGLTDKERQVLAERFGASPRNHEATAHREVAAWTHPVGTVVDVTRDDGTVQRTRTRSAAAVMCGSAVIWLEGISGCYRLSRVSVAVESEVAHG